MQKLKVNPKIKEMIEPLTEEEFAQLKDNIETDGCLDPIRVWAEHETIIDGHNRYEICTKSNIPFEIVEIEFETLDDVLIWVVENQLGRRNVTDKQRQYLIGQRYNLEKKKRGGQEKNECETVAHSDKKEKPGATAEKIAKEQGVSARTVMHNAKFASDVDEVAEKSMEPGKTKKTITKSNLTKDDVAKLKEKVKATPEKADEIIDEAVKEKTKKEKPTTSGVKLTLKDKVFAVFDRINVMVNRYNNTILSLQATDQKIRDLFEKYEKLVKTADIAKLIKFECNQNVELEKYQELTSGDYEAVVRKTKVDKRFDSIPTEDLISAANEMTTVMSLKPAIYDEGIEREELIEQLLDAIKYIQPKDKFSDETSATIKSLESKPVKKVAEKHNHQVEKEAKRKEVVKAAQKKKNEEKKKPEAKEPTKKVPTKKPTKKK